MASKGVSPLLVGRTSELRRLHEALEGAGRGEPGVVVVGGEAGVGKSRLVNEISAEADLRVRVLAGACVEGGGDGLPFAPVVDVLRDLSRSTPPDELDQLFGRARPDIARLLPEVGPGTQQASVAGSSAQLFELLLAVLDRAAKERPLLVVLEDLHWADGSTLEFLAFLVRALRDERLLLVGTYRSDEMRRGHPLRSLLAAWERSRVVQRLELSRFTEEQVREQLAAILDEPPEESLLRLVYDRSEGNAFLVEEVLGVVRSGADPQHLPDSLRDVLLSRVDGLTEPARQLLLTASVAGRWVAERLLSAVTGWADVELYAALREVVEQHLMVVDGAGRGYAFRHALTRDVVYSDMLPGERGALHMAYGTALAGDPSLAGADAATAATLAYHWYAALDLPRALDSSVEAARVASAAFASAEAQFHLERALELWPRVPDAAERTGTSLDELLGQAALSAYQAGQLDRARSLVERAVAAVPPEAGSRQLAVQLERKAEILRSLGHEDSAAADYRRALELLDPHVDQALRARVLGALARVVMVAGLPEEGVGIARDAVAAAEAAGLPASLAESLVSLGTSLAYSGDIDGGLAWLRQAHELAGTLPDPQHLLRCQVNFSDVLEMAGLHDEAEAVAAAGVALAAETGFSRSIGAFLTGNRIEPLLRLGRWDEAEQLAAAELRNGPAGVFRSSIVEVLARIAVYRGDYEAAEALTRNAVIGTVINWQYSLPIATTSAEIALGRRDLAAARRVVRQALEDRTSELDGRYLLPLLCVGYQVEAELGSATASDSLFELLSSLTPETAPLGLTQVAYHAVALAERARVQAAPGDVGSWSRAAAAAEDFGDVALLAYARLRLAEAQLRSGERTAATNLLQDVQRVALQLRARPILQAVEQLAARGRLPLGSAPTEGQRNLDSYGLTERERLVLGHLAAGRSNADIAVSLFISPKTASVHVSNLMAKLGVGNRVEAAALAYRLGVTPVEPAV